MTIWIILTLMCCLVCVALTIPLVRRYEGFKNSSHHAVEAYRIQIAEIERERASGVMSEADAQAATVELKRRMIAASDVKQQSRPLPDRVRLLMVPVTALVVAVASTFVYARLGSPSLVVSPGKNEMAAATSAPAPAAANLAPVEELTEKLRQRLDANPADAEGWRMLGWSHFNMQNYTAAEDAFGKALALQPANLDFKASLAEAMVQAEQGTVSPRAKQLFDEVLQSDPFNERARYYLALALEQKGADAEALQAWQSLLKDAPADAAWLQDARSHVEALGQKTGVDVSANPPPTASTLPDAVAPAISKEDMAAAQSLSPDDQQAMIKGMVERLASRLKANPEDAQGWVKLLRARMVMNDPQAARTALQEALNVFPPGSPGRVDIEFAARDLAIPVN